MDAYAKYLQQPADLQKLETMSSDTNVENKIKRWNQRVGERRAHQDGSRLTYQSNRRETKELRMKILQPDTAQ
jgi:hypothetical protein